MINIPIVTRKIKPNLKYRNLGGETIIIDTELTRTDILTENNWACWNFIDRRPDIKDVGIHKRYFYGHTKNNLGYVVCEDELESEIPKTNSDTNV